MFASEMMEKSTVVSAGDDDQADLTFANGANVAVISGEVRVEVAFGEVEPESGGFAEATHGAAAIPTPIPNATASPPTRPT
jgi:hypothetical protein